MLRIALTRELTRLYVSVFVAALGAASYVYFIPLYVQKFGGSFLDLGFAGTAYAVTYAAGPILVGYVADRVNRVWLYALGIALIAVATIALTVARSVIDIICLRLLAGLAFAFFWPTSEALVVDLASNEKRVSEMGFYSVSWASAYLIGPILGGLILQAYSYPWLFTVSFVLVTLALATSVSWVAPRYNSSLNRAGGGNVTHSLSIMRSLTPWYMVVLCYGTITGAIMSVFPGYANLVGISPTLIGVLFGAYSLSTIFIYAIIGRLQRFGGVRVLLTVSAVFGVGLLCIAIFPCFDGFLLGLILIGCCSATVFPIMIDLISNRFPSEKSGIAVGSYEGVYGLGLAIGPVLSGFIAEAASAKYAFVALSMFGVAMFLLVTLGKSSERTH